MQNSLKYSNKKSSILLNEFKETTQLNRNKQIKNILDRYKQYHQLLKNKNKSNNFLQYIKQKQAIKQKRPQLIYVESLPQLKKIKSHQNLFLQKNSLNYLKNQIQQKFVNRKEELTNNLQSQFHNVKQLKKVKSIQKLNQVYEKKLMQKSISNKNLLQQNQKQQIRQNLQSSLQLYKSSLDLIQQKLKLYSSTIYQNKKNIECQQNNIKETVNKKQLIGYNSNKNQNQKCFNKIKQNTQCLRFTQKKIKINTITMKKNQNQNSFNDSQESIRVSNFGKILSKGKMTPLSLSLADLSVSQKKQNQISKKQIICKLSKNMNNHSQKRIGINSPPKLITITKFNTQSQQQIQKSVHIQIKHKSILKQTIETNSSIKQNIQTKNISISQFFIGRQIGKGKFGKVFLCKHRYTGFICAIKIILKNNIKKPKNVQQLIREIKIQSCLNNCFNVKMYGFFDDCESIYLLLEYCNQGHLYKMLKQKNKFTQQQALPIIKEICEGIKYLHDNKIIHRDIKPQNIVMSFKMAKICDYGWSVNTSNQKRQTFCGTPLYVSPQLLMGKKYDSKIDIWALGILCFEILTGKLPFQVNCQKQLKKIMTSDIKYPSYLSRQAISFIDHLLQKNPNYRNDIDTVLKHNFLVLGLQKLKRKVKVN